MSKETVIAGKAPSQAEANTFFSEVGSDSPKTETLNVTARRVLELQNKIKAGIVTKADMKLGTPDAIRRHLTWEKQVKPFINEYLVLRVTDPTLPSVEEMRTP